MARAKHPSGYEPFDVTLPEGFEPAEHGPALEAAAKQSGWTIERDGAVIVVRDVWTENEDHAAWLVATKVGLPAERVTVWAGREAYRCARGIRRLATRESGAAQPICGPNSSPRSVAISVTASPT